VKLVVYFLFLDSNIYTVPNLEMFSILQRKYITFGILDVLHMVPNPALTPRRHHPSIHDIGKDAVVGGIGSPFLLLATLSVIYANMRVGGGSSYPLGISCHLYRESNPICHQEVL
jgi:hypothetical protein